jgi:HK97 family phage prohead protease
MLHKDFGLEVKAVSAEGIVEGYGSTFGGAPDSYNDVIVAGAFSESLVRHRRDGTMPSMLWGHKASELPIGNWTDMAEDGKGLWLKGEIDLEDPVGQRVHKALKRKSVRGLSIGFETLASKPDVKRPGVTFLEKIDLWEVSVVNFPANRRANVTDVKSDDRLQAVIEVLSAGGMPTERQFGKALQALGFPNAKSEALATVCKPILAGDPEAKANELVRFFQAMRA